MKRLESCCPSRQKKIDWLDIRGLMSLDLTTLPDDFPDYLLHTDADTPVPSWEQVTRSTAEPDLEMTEHVTRIIGAADDVVGRKIWEVWPGAVRRSVALLIDKIYNEGWLASVGPIRHNPWDGGFFFWPHKGDVGWLWEILDAKSGRRGGYTKSSLDNGLFAYLNSWNHSAWTESWMENNTGVAALHVGLFSDGTAEVHFEVYNPLYTRGAARSDVVRIPLLGSLNHKMFQLHRRWEHSEYAPITRTSANFYHLLRGRVPLSF